ncbi:MAG: helix-turn-helix transcriptional regulator [candidate division WOR-3 bacterium]
MRVPAQAFRFSSELGKRLRELRERAGLKQAEVAFRMGRHSSNLVSRLELGKPKFPTLGLIADFLAACGASFRDVADLLDRPGAERPKRKPRPKTLEQRIALIRKKAAPLGRQRALEDWLYSVVKSEGMPKKFVERKKLIESGRRIFRLMEQARRGIEAEKKALISSGISEKVADDLEAAVQVCLNNLAESGDLDCDTTVDAVSIAEGRAKLPRIKKADKRLEEELSVKLKHWRQMRYYTTERIKEEIREPLKQQGCNPPGPYLAIVPDFFQIAEETALDSEERKARTEARIAQVNDKDGVRKMAEMVYDLYEKYKVNIPARPFDWDAPVRTSRPGRR